MMRRKDNLRKIKYFISVSGSYRRSSEMTETCARDFIAIFLSNQILKTAHITYSENFGERNIYVMVFSITTTNL